jgi:hypothetical protein
VRRASETAHVASVGRIDEQESRRADFHACGIAEQAALVIEGEAYALAYLERLHACTARPGELAVIVEFLRDEMLHGACRVIEKALGAHHA